MISALSHTVDFDLDEIESSTARLCQYSVMHGGSGNNIGGPALPDKLWTFETGRAQGSDVLSDFPAIPHPSPFERQTSTSHSSDTSHQQRLGTFQCDADAILAQAQDIVLGHRMDDFINLDDYAS